MPEPCYRLTQIHIPRRHVQCTPLCRPPRNATLCHLGATLRAIRCRGRKQRVSSRTSGAAQRAGAKVSPRGAPSQEPGCQPPGQPKLGPCPHTLPRGSGWHSVTTCSGPQLLLTTTLPGYDLTTGRHCRCVPPTVWPMHLDPTKCPVGSPSGCPQQPGDVHGRGQRAPQGCRPRAPTLAVVDQHRHAPAHLRLVAAYSPERSPPAGDSGPGPNGY